MDALLGSDITPDQYPFFLLFGINYGERWGEYEEDNYASRLCFGIDRERGGIIMFESDMVEGTEFQIMFRTFDLEYMKPKFASLFDRLNGRKPVFAMYIDCAGRCAGYGGTDLEDALVLQQVVGNRVPVLGIYTGVEIASIAGRPRGLDWTGVFCLFSQDGDEASAIPGDKAHGPAKRQARESAPLDVANRLCVQNVSKILGLDAHAISLRYELELKRRGFRLISELAVSLRQTDDYDRMFAQVARRINSALNMQKTVVLLSDGTGMFMPSVLQGFPVDERERLLTGMSFALPKELRGLNPVIVTGASPPDLFAQVRQEFGLPFFITSPILIEGEVAAIMLTGRTVEHEPFFTRLGQSDLETVHAITELLCSVMVRLRMRDITRKAETDGLTGVWNRNVFQRIVKNYLMENENNAGAFMMIDVDYFKSVNDTYGHLVGDEVLKSCADVMRSILRDSDVIGRQGGDEFAVFCKGIKDGPAAEKKAGQINEVLRKIVPEGGEKHITVSIGISLSPVHGTTFKQLYHNADAAMYKVKGRGKNGYLLAWGRAEAGSAG
jgi:diguanylate cyclase (GGDEF)-like protein